MSKQKTTKKEVEKVKLNGRQRFDKYVMPVLTFLMGVASLVLLLGLAAKGLTSYLGELSETQQTVASVVGVSIMAYAVASLTRLFSK